MSEEPGPENQEGVLPADQVRRGLAEEEGDVDQYGTDPTLAEGADEGRAQPLGGGQDADRR